MFAAMDNDRAILTSVSSLFRLNRNVVGHY